MLSFADYALALRPRDAASDAGVALNQRLTIGVVVACLALSILTFCLRIYCRMVSSAKLWWDDYWMCFVMVLCFGMTACDLIGKT